ncbi:MAG: sigma-54-dependent Fis family transcriptional regulator [bacterium]|nr:sigma-54-dependent Fis family transcriptional regulator [bacterium]
MANVLLVEDQAHLRTILKIHLQKHQHKIDEAADLKTAAWKLDQGLYDVIIMDLKLPDGVSISLFDKHQQVLSGKTIIITANATVSSVVEAIKKGAFNYLEKPVDKDLLAAQVKNIIDLNSLKRDHQALIDEVSSNFTFDNVIYESKKMDQIISRAKVLAKTGNTILLHGETGCGKEVLAHSIHNCSPRKDNVFIPVNCASIPTELFESELFGFDKGAFTGAVSSYSGRFIQADKGTLFLDEIGELPLPIQAKLLRVLDDKTIYPLKSKNPVTMNARLVTATNRDLQKEVKLKQFRSDLYYRMLESSIKIPPLRERVEDILPLIRHFIEVYNHVYDKEVTRIAAEAEKYFLTYAWEGNVRELKNTIKSIIPFKVNNTISMEDLSYSLIQGSECKKNKVMTLEESEKKHIYWVLKLTDFNVLRTSELLGISRPRLYRKMKEYKLEMVEEEI